MPDRAPTAPTHRAPATLIALALLAFVLGSVHAFSVLVAPLTQAFGASVTAVSATYSLALVSITAMVALGHRFYALLPAYLLVALITSLAVLGALIAGQGGALVWVWLGFGAIFGAANGAGYGFSLQLAAQATPGREGLAMGGITAAYALGATLFPAVFDWALSGGIPQAMTALAWAIGAVGLTATALLRFSGARFRPVGSGTPAPEVPPGEIALLWAAYGAAVLAGLMTMGHAVGIARAEGLAAPLLLAAPMVVALCNMGGSLGGGWLTDRLAPRALLTALPLLSAGALGALAFGLPVPVLAALGTIGLVYGAVISAYPAVIARRFGVAAGVPVYGRVFTAWAVAGICGPMLAGAMFDLTGSFTTALLIAGLLSCLSALLAWRNRG